LTSSEKSIFAKRATEASVVYVLKNIRAIYLVIFWHKKLDKKYRVFQNNYTIA